MLDEQEEDSFSSAKKLDFGFRSLDKED